MSRIVVKTEVEKGNGWSFEVDVIDEETTEFEVTLNWSDYDLWCHGKTAPEKVIDAAFRFLMEREPVSAIMRRFDCAVIRRYFSEVDRVLPTML